MQHRDRSLRSPSSGPRPIAALVGVFAAVLVTLGVGSGCAMSSPIPGSTARLVEKSVDGDALQRIFRGAFLETEAINERAVRVSLDGVRYQVVAEPDRKLLIYLTHFRFRADVDSEERLSFVNKLNSKFIYTRFSVDGDGDLACEYFLSFKGGIDENQVVDALQWMTNTTVGSITQADEGNIIR